MQVRCLEGVRRRKVLSFRAVLRNIQQGQQEVLPLSGMGCLNCPVGHTLVIGWGQPKIQIHSTDTEARIHGGGHVQWGDICQIHFCSSKAEMCMVHFHGHDNPVLSSGARGVNKRDTIPASRSIQSGGAS